MISLLFCTLLSLISAVILSRCFSRLSSDRFWFGSAIFFLQISGVAVLLSMGGILRADTWLLLQLLISLSVWGFVYRCQRGQANACFVNLFSRGGLQMRFQASLNKICNDGVVGVLFCLLVFVLACLFWVRAHTPLYGFDELMYHASRPLYWIGHQSVFPFESHNDRHNVFTFGAELWFLFAIIHTQSEYWSRLFFMLQLPLALTGAYVFLSRFGISRRLSLLVLLAVLLMPMTLRESLSLKPEVGTIWVLLGYSYFFARLTAHRTDYPGWVGLCLFVAVGLAYKLTFLVFLPLSAGLLLWKFYFSSARWRIAKVVIISGLSSLFLSSAWITLGSNYYYFGKLTGPPLFSEEHRSGSDWNTMKTHLVRIPFVLWGLPWIPSETARQGLEGTGQAVSEFLGANELLRGEVDYDFSWPGIFKFEQPRWDQRFSYFGIVGAMGVLWLAIRHLLRRFCNGRRIPRMFWAMLPACLLGMAIFMVIRWQAAALLPDRFLLPVISVCLLSLPLIVHPYWRRAGQWGVKVFVVSVLLVGSLPGAKWLVDRMAEVSEGVERAPENAYFVDIVDKIPEGSRILFFGGHVSGDYFLFNPAHNYSNRVIPWGKQAFDPQVLEQVLREQNISHVVLETLFHARFEPHPPLPLAPFYRYFIDSGRFRLVSDPESFPVLLEMNSFEALNAVHQCTRRSPINHDFYTREWVNDERWGDLWLYGNGWKRSDYMAFFDDRNFPDLLHDSVLREFTVTEINPETGRIILRHEKLGYLASVSDDIHVLYKFDTEKHIFLFNRRFFPADIQVIETGEYYNLQIME